MEDADEFPQQQVREERRLFVERHFQAVATPNPAFLPGSETTETAVVAKHGVVGQRRCAPIFHQPKIGAGGAGIDRLEVQGQGTALGAVAPEIVCAGVSEILSHRALSSGFVPCAGEGQVAEDGGVRRIVSPHLLAERLVCPLHLTEEAVGAVGAAEEAAVESHPFGAGEGRDLHVVRTLDERDAEPCEIVLPRVLHGGKEERVGAGLLDAFSVRIDGTADVGHFSAVEEAADVGTDDIGGVSHSRDGVGDAEAQEQGSVDGGGEYGAAQRCVNDRSFRQLNCGRNGVRHEHVGGKRFLFRPRVSDDCDAHSAAVSQTEQTGVRKQGIAVLVPFSMLLTSTKEREKGCEQEV